MFRFFTKTLVNKSLSWALGSTFTTQLHNAVAAKDLPTVKRLIEDEDIYIDLQDQSSLGVSDIHPLYMTPLHLAIYYGHAELATYLLSQGASPNKATGYRYYSFDIKNPYPWRPLDYALRFGRFDIATLLIEQYGQKIDDASLKIIKDYGLVDYLPFIKKFVLINSAMIAATHKKHHEIQAMALFEKHEAHKEAKELENSFPNRKRVYQQRRTLHYTDRTTTLAGQACSELTEMQYALRQCVQTDEIELLRNMLEFQHFFKDAINDAVYDIQKGAIDKSFILSHPAICESLLDDSYVVSQSASHYDEADNTRKAPIIFLAILRGNKELISTLIKGGADLNVTVNNISATQLLNALYSEEDVNELIPRSSQMTFSGT